MLDCALCADVPPAASKKHPRAASRTHNSLLLIKMISVGTNTDRQPRIYVIDGSPFGELSANWTTTLGVGRTTQGRLSSSAGLVNCFSVSYCYSGFLST